jgi:hypothetical protein
MLTLEGTILLHADLNKGQGCILLWSWDLVLTKDQGPRTLYILF